MTPLETKTLQESVNYRTWQFLLDPPHSASYNMGKDHACLDRAQQQGVPILRCYRWRSPTLSIGRVQRLEEDIHLADCLHKGIEVVRRMTGGKAVLHDGDWTYSVSAPRDAFGQSDAQSVLGIYRCLSSVFVRFFTELGLQVETHAYQPRQRAMLASAICFATPSAFEITCNGKKLLGSAQRLTPHAFLQHGSLPCRTQHNLLQSIFISPEAAEMNDKMTDLQSLGVDAAQQESIPQRLQDAFSHVLGVDFEPCLWSAEDEASAQARLVDYPLITPETESTSGQLKHSAKG